MVEHDPGFIASVVYRPDVGVDYTKSRARYRGGRLQKYFPRFSDKNNVAGKSAPIAIAMPPDILWDLVCSGNRNYIKKTLASALPVRPTLDQQPVFALLMTM